MKMNPVHFITAAIGVLIGLASILLYQALMPSGETTSATEKKPLYWVAPMDSNYRRDKPGKSPMGMDLVPVYEEETKSASEGPGVVSISPTVVNNLGVRTAPVSTGALDNVIHTVGYIRYAEDSLLHIHPRVEGWVEKLHIKAAGEEVKAGEPLYTLYAPQLVNAQEEFLIALKRADKTLLNAARERLDALQLPKQFIKSLEQSRKVSQTVTFYAPQSGVLDELNIREGFYIQPGTTLMSIGQLEKIWVDAEVFESDTASIKPGLPVTMTVDYFPGQLWKGQVDYVYPSLNAKNRTLRVRLKFENPQRRLKPNMFAQVTIHVEHEVAVTYVPKSAVIRTGQQARVVVALGEGQFKSVAVETGRSNKRHVEILSGLKANDRVVTSAQFLIDSESSKTSDFARMSQAAQATSVWAEGRVNSVMQGHRMVNITHQPVKEWDWPEMTMDFTVAESVDMDALAKADSLHFEITKTDSNEYQITSIHVMSEKDSKANQATVIGTINQMDSAARVLNISRGPIEKWNRPAATMDFEVAEHVDLSPFEEGQTITFTFEVGENFIIIDMQPADAKQSDHSQHKMRADGGENL
ncbi:efflux RND transporter periplasmic adaptor subunit [Alteromonas ponticola]|uniref:Efflux RND transporter periplasmic adaptor subunit n=1 Tax=Alteromonas aquimaris TaxID=2998417 RepID=A0ABT3PAV3_9ALTE|nr:efflux RND transporter periplasmic adaptor subunit [Alteromonas aquimaris]MCW8109918.1 efflux RND transporter periplasmic adaptor subunit [Alteromonas aquimaris]